MSSLGPGTRLSEDQVLFVKQRLQQKLPHRRIQMEFEERFRRRLPQTTLNNISRQYGLQYPAGRGGTFKPGNVPANTRNLYEERWSSDRDGRPVLLIKVPPEYMPPRSVKQGAYFIRKARWVYMQAHGEAPKSHVIVQLDGNPANCDLDNLVCMSRADWMRRVREESHG